MKYYSYLVSAIDCHDLISIAKKFTTLFSIALILSCSSGLPSVEKPAPSIGDSSKVVDYGRELIKEMMAENEVPGVSVVLVDKNKVIWSEGFGWSSRDNNEALTSDTAMQLGSVTKLFTAIAIMQLVEQDKLDLDADLTNYLPEYSIQSRFQKKDFTIRQMLSHHSGLPSDLLDGFKFYRGKDEVPSNLVEQFRAIPSQTKLLHMASEPGMIFSYSNLSYSLLGNVIERVTGKSYSDYIREHILSPIKMNGTFILTPKNSMLASLSNGYIDSQEIKGSFVRNLSAGGMASSAKDMAKFLQVFINDEESVLSQRSKAIMMQPQNGGVQMDGDLRSGIGFRLSNLEKQPFSIQHGGDINPYHAYIQILPEQNLAIAVMTNSDKGIGLVNYAATQILDVAYKNNIKTEEKLIKQDIAVEKKVNFSEKEAKEISGLYYTGRAIGIVEVANKGSELTLKFIDTGLATMKMFPLEDNKFDLGLRLFGILPLPMSMIMPGGKLPKFQLQRELINNETHFWLTANGLRTALAVPIDKAKIHTGWLERQGTYVPKIDSQSLIHTAELNFDETSGFMNVVVSNNITPTISIPIRTLSESQASTIGVGRFHGEVIESISENTIRYGGLEFQRIQNH